MNPKLKPYMRVMYHRPLILRTGLGSLGVSVIGFFLVGLIACQDSATGRSSTPTQEPKGDYRTKGLDANNQPGHPAGFAFAFTKASEFKWGKGYYQVRLLDVTREADSTRRSIGWQLVSLSPFQVLATQVDTQFNDAFPAVGYRQFAMRKWYTAQDSGLFFLNQLEYDTLQQELVLFSFSGDTLVQNTYADTLSGFIAGRGDDYRYRTDADYLTLWLRDDAEWSAQKLQPATGERSTFPDAERPAGELPPYQP